MDLEIKNKQREFFIFRTLGNFSPHHMHNYLNRQVAGFNHGLYKAWTIELMTSLDTSKLNKTPRKHRSANLNLYVTIYIYGQTLNFNAHILRLTFQYQLSSVLNLRSPFGGPSIRTPIRYRPNNSEKRNGRKKIIRTHMRYNAMSRFQLNACFASCFLSALFCEILMKRSIIV